MRIYLFILTAVFLIFNFFSNASEIHKKGIIIPAYFYDGQIWDRLINGKKEDTDFIVILNPNSGPGEIQDPHYVSIINRLNGTGIVPIGYVHTSWGSRDIEEVKGEIDKWFELYPDIKGFFLDEASTGKDDFSYYEELYRYIKEKGDFTVVLNPGTETDIIYFSIADYIITYESPYYEYSGCNAEIPEKSGCIVYDVPENEIESIIKNENVKLIYLTDDRGNNPYDSLPSYYEKEVSLLSNPNNESSYASGIIIPAYFDDSNIWERIFSLDLDGVDMIVIVNPENGVGNSYSSYYRELINRLNEKGIKPVGYIFTNYGRKPLRKVKREIKRWLRWYPGIKGFFIDQVSTSKRKIRYYKRIYRFIKRKGDYTVILDPGAPPNKKYYRYADLIITSVNDYQDDNSCYVQFPEKDGCILYNASYGEMKEKILNENVRFIYLTDYNDFDDLPSYLEEEIDIIKR